jgi:hypothetical protein
MATRCFAVAEPAEATAVTVTARAARAAIAVASFSLLLLGETTTSGASVVAGAEGRLRVC